jgi:Sec7-like guanine-nucleotide exchange factor
MILRWVKWGVMGTVGLGLLGGMLFGKDIISYAKSSAKGVRAAVKDSVPIEFELRRARDLLEEIIPEMQANIRVIAQEEVEVAALKGEIAKQTEALGDEQSKIKTLRVALEQPRAQYAFAGRSYSHDEVKHDLAARFERFKESEVVLASKVKVLQARERSLDAAREQLAKTAGQKRILESKIEALTGQYRLVKAASTGTQFQMDNSKLAQTEKLIEQIQKRLDVAERVLAAESKFVESIPVDTVVESDLMAQVDEYFDARNQTAPADKDASAVTMAEPAGVYN